MLSYVRSCRMKPGFGLASGWACRMKRNASSTVKFLCFITIDGDVVRDQFYDFETSQSSHLKTRAVAYNRRKRLPSSCLSLGCNAPGPYSHLTRSKHPL